MITHFLSVTQCAIGTISHRICWRLNVDTNGSYLDLLDHSNKISGHKKNLPLIFHELGGINTPVLLSIPAALVPFNERRANIQHFKKLHFRHA